jgi:hypothetical protein
MRALFRILAGLIAVGSLMGAVAIAIAGRGTERVLSVAFLLLPTVFFGRVALTGAGLSEWPYVPSDDFDETGGNAKSEDEKMVAGGDPDAMPTRFPLFLADSDGWMGRYEDERSLGALEENDVADGEQRGWDASGVPVRIAWEGGRTVVKASGMAAEPDALLVQVRAYARLESAWDALPEAAKMSRDVNVLWPRVAAVIEEREGRRPINRFIQWLRRLHIMGPGAQ